jgi:polyhydroxybutyrate depolymerase
MSKSTFIAAVVAAGLLLAACGDSDTTSPTDTTEGVAPSGPVPSAGCGGAATEAEAGADVERTFLLGDTERRYLLTTPSAHDGGTPVPIVFDFHGLMEGADIHAQMSQYSVLAEEEGVVAVFPHGSGDPIGWDFDPASDPNEDLRYFDAVLEEVGAALCLDESRVYLTGLSMGAMFSSLLLCERADVFAAAAPVAGLQDLDGCEPSRAVPIVAFHGTDDPITLFNGGVDTGAIPGFNDELAHRLERLLAVVDTEGYPANVAAWAERNGCQPESTDTEVSPEVVHRVHECPEGADVEFYVVVGGGHSWPSSEFSRSIEQIVGYTTFDIDGTRDAWAFMSRFSLA